MDDLVDYLHVQNTFSCLGFWGVGETRLGVCTVTLALTPTLAMSRERARGAREMDAGTGHERASEREREASRVAPLEHVVCCWDGRCCMAQ